MERIAGWCERFSPVVGGRCADDHDAVFVDLTPVRHLYPNEMQPVCEIVAELSQWGRKHFAVAVAASVTAAAAVAQFCIASTGQRRHSKSSKTNSKGMLLTPIRAVIVSSQATERVLSRLPIELLRLPAPVERDCRELGIVRVGQLLEIPRCDCVARWGEEIALHLDRGLARVGEPVPPLSRRNQYLAETYLEHPIANTGALLEIIAALLRELVAQLERDLRGALETQCRLVGEQGTTAEFRLATFRPCRSAEYLASLAVLELERQGNPGNIELVTMKVLRHAPLQWRQETLFEDEKNSRQKQREAARLLERLAARLGNDRVCAVEPVADVQPEHSLRHRRWQDALRPCRGRARENETAEEKELRPLRLCSPPEPVSVLTTPQDGPPYRIWLAGEMLQVAWYWGPERIETGWWRGPPVSRDYYRAEIEDGRRVWLFRDRRTGRWFLHGWFD